MIETPDFRYLADQGLLTYATYKALKNRSIPRTSVEEPFLGEPCFSILVALCEILRPKYEHPNPIEIAAEIDDRLARRKTNGWRYDAMPSDEEAYRIGILALNEEANETFGLDFRQVPNAGAEDLVRRLQTGVTTTPSWSGVSSKFFLEELLDSIVEVVYSHPSVQSAIGYVGFADAKGWSEIGLNEREIWES